MGDSYYSTTLPLYCSTTLLLYLSTALLLYYSTSLRLYYSTLLSSPLLYSTRDYRNELGLLQQNTNLSKTLKLSAKSVAWGPKPCKGPKKPKKPNQGRPKTL